MCSAANPIGGASACVHACVYVYVRACFLLHTKHTFCTAMLAMLHIQRMHKNTLKPRSAPEHAASPTHFFMSFARGEPSGPGPPSWHIELLFTVCGPRTLLRAICRAA